jgi:hypothetical protein
VPSINFALNSTHDALALVKMAMIGQVLLVFSKSERYKHRAAGYLPLLSRNSGGHGNRPTDRLPLERVSFYDDRFQNV